MVMKPRTISMETFKKAFVFLLHTFLLSSLPFALNSVSSKRTEAEALVSYLQNLTYLGLSLNYFIVKIPESLFINLGKLEYLNLTGIGLASNNFSSLILDIFGSMPNLKILELSSFEEKIPSSLGKLRNLQLFRLLIDSPLNSTIPSELGLCTNLTQLILSGSSLTGSLPLSLTNLTKLFGLVVIDSNFCGHILLEEIPFEIGLLTNLTFLNLNGNRFSGYIPQMIGSLQNLFFLDLSVNLLLGQIPPTIENLTELRSIDIFSNHLTVSKLSKGLQVLNLKNNYFYGTIPRIFPEGCELQYLDLYGNQLSGTLPLSLVNCRMLEVIDTGNNSISGSFPFWMKTLPEFRVLILKANRF
ncbi:probable LRR receptor-like serine/threonine-protein kinase At4g36180 [Olea europaea var. sylvestris]|uniref:probable LRR receptor-like serine/threonine-protein kinase At4g36180 n=1 Tax=Olea europaea var. sylvestris TaxID=158386 RepID=UPI000C1CE3BE|nr:probable LRR receptor-like serine/threonine-protein kinase At4g36180 [Olea europaea var. sylvestris]